MATVKPKKPVASKPGQGMNSNEQKFWNSYSKAVKTGTNSLTDLGWYQGLSNRHKATKATVSTQGLQNASIKALNGDKYSQDYLKRMSYKPLEGKSLWNGYDTKKLKYGTSAYNVYRRDNPHSEISKNYDINHYNAYTEKIKSGAPMSNQEMDFYKTYAVDKWNMEDMSNPFVQQKHALKDAEKSQMSAQDQSLNNSMGQLDANNFQQFQQAQQGMADRGIADSGMAQDAYARMQMGANRDYQDAFVQATQNKADIQNNFIGQRAEVDKNMSDEAMAKEQMYLDDNQATNTLQQKQDEFLTTSSGTVYMSGKQLKMNGKPIATMDMLKLTEEQRHNVATENNVSNKTLLDYQAAMNKNAITQQGNQLDYQVGMGKNAVDAQGNQMSYDVGLDKNAVAREKIAADVSKSMATLELNYAKLDKDYTKIESDNLIAQATIKQAADNAQTSKDKNAITALGAKSKTLSQQIVAYQKNGKKPPKSLVDQYNNVNNAISDIVGGSSFKSSGGGGGNHTLGSLSKKYESGSSGAGTIGNTSGDWGGKSYGTYQIASNTGTLKSFMSYLKSSDPSVYKILSSHRAGSSGFDAAWKKLAKTQNSRFDGLQHEFIKKSHYSPAASKMKSSTGIDPSKRSSALQNVIWSMGVQHGAGGANSIFKNAGINNSMSDKAIIQRLYSERMNVNKYFSRSSSKVKAGVKSRFQRELSDALGML